jgi:Inner membrane component of T3SS, cytoplasmic domain
MAKFCPNGHQMEDSWETCPYCVKTGFADADYAKTRVESGAPREAPTASPRRTVLISEKRKPPVVGWFVALSGEQKGEDFRIRDGQNVLGTAPECDIVIRDSTVSAKHASLRYKDGKFILSDLDSSNGTFLNDRSEPIAREEIKDNDLIRVGEINLKFKCL